MAAATCIEAIGSKTSGLVDGSSPKNPSGITPTMAKSLPFKSSDRLVTRITAEPALPERMTHDGHGGADRVVRGGEQMTDGRSDAERLEVVARDELHRSEAHVARQSARLSQVGPAREARKLRAPSRIAA